MTTTSSGTDKAGKGVGVGTVATYTPVCSETEENPAVACDEHEVAKVDMEKKQGESPEEQDKLQWSKALKEEVDSNQAESPVSRQTSRGKGGIF